MVCCKQTGLNKSFVATFFGISRLIPSPRLFHPLPHPYATSPSPPGLYFCLSSFPFPPFSLSPLSALLLFHASPLLSAFLVSPLFSYLPFLSALLLFVSLSLFSLLSPSTLGSASVCLPFPFYFLSSLPSLPSLSLSPLCSLFLAFLFLFLFLFNL